MPFDFVMQTHQLITDTCALLHDMGIRIKRVIKLGRRMQRIEMYAQIMSATQRGNAANVFGTVVCR